MNPPILQEILATVPDDGTRVEDIQVYANWIISKAQRPAISTLFHGMPGLPPRSCGTWMGDYRGARPAGLWTSSNFFLGMLTVKK